MFQMEVKMYKKIQKQTAVGEIDEAWDGKKTKKGNKDNCN